MFINHLGKKTEVTCFRNSCLGKKKNPSATKCCEDVTKKMPMCSCILCVMVQAELRSTHSNSGPASSSALPLVQSVTMIVPLHPAVPQFLYLEK